MLYNSIYMYIFLKCTQLKKMNAGTSLSVPTPVVCKTMQRLVNAGTSLSVPTSVVCKTMQRLVNGRLNQTLANEEPDR